MGNYITSGSLVDYITTGSLSLFELSGHYLTTLSDLAGTYLSIINADTTYQTVAGLNKSSVGLGNVDNTSYANKPVSTATQMALGLEANLESPIFTGTLKLTIGGFNYDLITRAWVGGWLQFSSMTVQKQIGSNNFSFVRSLGWAAGSFDISFPAHPAGGSYMIMFLHRKMSSGALFVYGYGGVINSTGFTVSFSNISGTNIMQSFVCSFHVIS